MSTKYCPLQLMHSLELGLEVLHHLLQHVDRYRPDLIHKSLFEGFNYSRWICLKHFFKVSSYKEVASSSIEWARRPRDIPATRNNATGEQSIYSINWNSCGMACCSILMEKCMLTHWKTGKLWCEKVLPENVLVFLRINKRVPCFVLEENWTDNSTHRNCARHPHLLCMK